MLYVFVCGIICQKLIPMRMDIYTMISLCMQKCFYDDSIVLSWRRNLFLFSDSNSSVVETRSRFCFVLFCFFSFFFFSFKSCWVIDS